MYVHICTYTYIYTYLYHYICSNMILEMTSASAFSAELWIGPKQLPWPSLAPWAWQITSQTLSRLSLHGMLRIYLQSIGGVGQLCYVIALGIKLACNFAVSFTVGVLCKM